MLVCVQSGTVRFMQRLRRMARALNSRKKDEMEGYTRELSLGASVKVEAATKVNFILG